MNSHSRNQQNYFSSNSAADAKFNFSSIISRFQTYFNDCVYYLVRDQEPRVWQKRNRFGGLQWCAYDPLTGRSIECATENEVRVWLESILCQ